MTDKSKHTPTHELPNELRKVLQRAHYPQKQIERIVHAVNAYEPMVEILERLDQFFVNGTSVSPSMQMDSLTDDNYTLGLAVRQAIALAEPR